MADKIPPVPKLPNVIGTVGNTPIRVRDPQVVEQVDESGNSTFWFGFQANDGVKKWVDGSDVLLQQDGYDQNLINFTTPSGETANYILGYPDSSGSETSEPASIL